MTSIIKASSLSVSDVHFGAIRKNDLGGKFIPLKNATGGKLLLQLPEMRTPFGLSSMADQATGKVNFSVPLSFDNDNQACQDIAVKFAAIDEMVVNEVHENCKELMGKQQKIDVLREGLYRPILTLSKDPEKYGPMLKAKVLTNRDGTFVPEAYNSHRQPVDLDAIERGGKAATIVELVHCYVIDGKFGVSARLSQLKMGTSQKLSGYAFQEDDDETQGQGIMEDEMDDLAL